MSADFLANLASRAIEHDFRAVDGVRPRLASLFEASPVLSGQQGDRVAMAEVEPDRVAAGPGAERPFAATVRREAPPIAPAQPATASENLDFRLAAVVDAVYGPQRNSSVLAPMPSPSGSFGTVSSPAVERREGATGDSLLRPQMVGGAGLSGSMPVTPVLSAQGQRDSTRRGEEWRPPALATRPPAAQPAAALLPDYRTEGAAVAPEPVIQVTIGRIEVRATQASPAARKAGPSARPATLDEYQKQRGQRGGGR